MHPTTQHTLDCLGLAPALTDALANASRDLVLEKDSEGFIVSRGPARISLISLSDEVDEGNDDEDPQPLLRVTAYGQHDYAPGQGAAGGDTAEEPYWDELPNGSAALTWKANLPVFVHAMLALHVFRELELPIQVRVGFSEEDPIIPSLKTAVEDLTWADNDYPALRQAHALLDALRRQGALDAQLPAGSPSRAPRL